MKVNEDFKSQKRCVQRDQCSGYILVVPENLSHSSLTLIKQTYKREWGI